MPHLEIRDTAHEDSRKIRRPIVEFSDVQAYSEPRLFRKAETGVALKSVLGGTTKLRGASIEAFEAAAAKYDPNGPDHIIYYPYTQQFFVGSLRDTYHCG